LIYAAFVGKNGKQKKAEKSRKNHGGMHRMHGPPVLLCGVLGKLGGDEPVQESELLNPGRKTCFLLLPRCSSMFFHITKCYEPECPEAFCKHHQGPERCAALIFSACE
jgi:hypothetical protein